MHTAKRLDGSMPHVSTGDCEPLPASGRVEVYSSQEHGQFLTANHGHLLVVLYRWHLERALLESLVPNRQPITIPIEDLQLVAPSIDKQKQVDGLAQHL